MVNRLAYQSKSLNMVATVGGLRCKAAVGNASGDGVLGMTRSPSPLVANRSVVSMESIGSGIW